MNDVSRRELLKRSALLAGGLLLSPSEFTSAAPDPVLDFSQKYVTCFYQFGPEALQRFVEKSSLPNGPGYAHIFSHSSPGRAGRPERAKTVHAGGESFKWAPAFDVAKYEGWESADDATLKGFAKEFRDHALDAAGPADFFAFNEMPPAASPDEKLRGQVTKLIRYLNDAGGGPKLRGVFYLTEENLNLATWKGSSDELWQALDETCDLVVAEHYHSDEYIFARTLEQFSDHLFGLAKTMDQQASANAKNIARKKFCVLHSSYWGKSKTPWEGMVAEDHEVDELEAYFHRCIAATRASEFGQKRIAFGPLGLKAGELGNDVYPVLAKALAKDARGIL